MRRCTGYRERPHPAVAKAFRELLEAHVDLEARTTSVRFERFGPLEYLTNGSKRFIYQLQDLRRGATASSTPVMSNRAVTGF